MAARQKLKDEDFIPPPLRLENKDTQALVEEVLRCLQFDVATVERIQEVFKAEMERGMKSEPSSLQMENTYIPELPDGSEEGKYMALDLGGTNFRVLLAEFHEGRVAEVEVEHYQVNESLRLGPGVDLFDFLAECVADFIDKKGLSGLSIPLGFTFSFPMAQHSLTTGVLVSWTKTFNCSDVVGEDAVRLLNEALHRRGCQDVAVHAVLNDTTGTLMMGALLDKETSIGLILGTGSNACYLERADRVQHWETERHGEKEVIIDVEWGAFGDNGVLDFIKTDFDKAVDDNSLLVSSFTFEKYISGKYMGEIVRVVLEACHKAGAGFRGGLGALSTPGALTTEGVSRIEEDTPDNPVNTTAILKALSVHPTAEDVSITQHACRTVSNRAALLVATCLSVLLDRMAKERSTIAVDGSLFSKHHSFRRLIRRYLGILTDRQFKLLQVSDGSGIGAAVAVSIAIKLERRFGSPL